MRAARCGPLLAAVVVAAGLGACGGKGGASGAVAGKVPSTTTTMTSSTIPTGASATALTGPTTSTSGAGGPSSSPPSTSSTAPPAGGGLRLGGDDLGVTRVGAPFRDAVAAVSSVLGRPAGDPAPDSACVGADDETTWASFRLGSSGGRLSGWASSSRTLATPAGVTVGTTRDALRQAYGDQLQLPPPVEDSATIFLVPGARLGGTLTGGTGSDRVTSLFNGTCESQ